MKTTIYKSILFALTSFSFTSISAQTILKMGNQGGPAGTGPATTNKTVVLYQNGNTTYNSMLSVTYSFSNQQYGAGRVEGVVDKPMMNFGGDINGDNSTMGERPFYSSMNAISNPQNNMFKACSTCTGGIDVATDKAISLFSCTDAFISSTNGTNLKSLTARVYIGDLTITFNQPVTNPIIQLVGMGGTTSLIRNNKYYDLGFTTEFDLIGTRVSLSKVAGNKYLSVTNNKILNNATSFGTMSEGLVHNGITRNAASGSVMVSGTAITSISFKVFIRGDGGRISNGSTTVTADNGLTPLWGFGSPNPFNANAGVSGDLMLMGVSVARTNIALPAHVFEASATVNATKVVLNWKTENEINTSHFSVERKTNNGAFETIGTQAAAGNFAGTKNYTITDDIATILSNAIQYRVKLIDIDGKVSYTNIVTLNTTAFESVKTWPNPFASNVNIALRSSIATSVTTRIFDMSGKLVAQTTNVLSKGNNQLNISNLNNLNKGFYMLHISDVAGNINYTEKIIK
ncbi:MAG: hypothetical protein RL115_346 [Bacteroidota bacterium]